jgi:hypothetical protein
VAHALGGSTLLVDPLDLESSAATAELLSERAAELTRVYVAGGTAAISADVVEQVRALVR